jgi:peptidoglycan/LPS O-acetylase OafA/YrhL
LLQQIALTERAGTGVSPRREDVEGLRAFAVVAVVLFHYFPANFAGGFVGVDVFFLISGYVVTLSIARRIACRRFTFRDFYSRRIRRLFPALAIVSLACLAASWAFDFQREFATWPRTASFLRLRD